MTKELSSKIFEIAHVRRRFGYRRIHDMLRPHFPGVNHKRVYRLYSAANLSVRKRKKVTRLWRGGAQGLLLKAEWKVLGQACR